MAFEVEDLPFFPEVEEDDPHQQEDEAWEAVDAAINNRINAAAGVAGFSRAGKPTDVCPSLDGSDDDLDAAQADVLHHQAGRWLEYVTRERALVDARVLVLEDEISRRTAKLRFVHGDKIKEWPEGDFDILQKLEEKKTDLKATALLLKGTYDSLNKVKAVASRTITRHKD